MCVCGLVAEKVRWSAQMMKEKKMDIENGHNIRTKVKTKSKANDRMNESEAKKPKRNTQKWCIILLNFLMKCRGGRIILFAVDTHAERMTSYYSNLVCVFVCRYRRGVCIVLIRVTVEIYDAMCFGIVGDRQPTTTTTTTTNRERDEK